MSEFEYKTNHGLPAEYPGEWELFINNIDLLVSHTKVIKSRKELFYTELSFAHVSTTLTGTNVLTVGMLATLWERKEFLATCPECHGRVYIVNAVGSMLSGIHKYQGVCCICRDTVSGTKKTFHELYSPSLKIAIKHANHTVMKKTVGHYFSPGGESMDSVSEIVVKEKIRAMTLEEMIEELILLRPVRK